MPNRFWGCQTKLNLPKYTKTKYWCKSYFKELLFDVTIPRVGLRQLVEEAIGENRERAGLNL